MYLVYSLLACLKVRMHVHKLSLSRVKVKVLIHRVDHINQEVPNEIRL